MNEFFQAGRRTEVAGEFDHDAIRRSGRALRDYLLALSLREDRFQLREKVLPIVDQALSGRLALPFDDQDEPLRYEAIVGLLPKEYVRLSTAFWLHITGALTPELV